MPNQIKILLFTLTALASFSVVSAFINIRNISTLGANVNGLLGTETNNLPDKISQSEWLKTTRSDIDKDGLFDDEETLYRTDPLNKDSDGDGFLDGEEVVSGHDPLKPGPYDLLPKTSAVSTTDKINLTKYFESLIVGGVLSKDLDQSSPNFQNHVELLAQEASTTRKTLLSVNDFGGGKIANENNPEKKPQEYLNSFEDILIEHFLKESADIKIDKIKDFDFSPYINDLNILQGKLLELNPPSDWLGTHKEFLKFISKLTVYFTNLNNQKDDPVKAFLTIENTQSLLSEYEKLLKTISTKVKKDNLRTKIFDI